MTIRLEYIGKPSPARDMQAFVTGVRRADPSLTNAQVEKAVRRAMVRNRPRHKGNAIIRFGGDILGGDLTQMPAWQYMPGIWRQNLPLHPVEGGFHMEGDAAERLANAIAFGDPRQINRRSLMHPAGLQQTYVWRHENGWIQEVTAHDVAIIRATPVLNRCFRNPDMASGPFVIQRYDREVRDQQVFRNIDEFHAFTRDRERRTLYPGSPV